MRAAVVANGTRVGVVMGGRGEEWSCRGRAVLGKKLGLLNYVVKFN